MSLPILQHVAKTPNSTTIGINPKNVHNVQTVEYCQLSIRNQALKRTPTKCRMICKKFRLSTVSDQPMMRPIASKARKAIQQKIAESKSYPAVVIISSVAARRKS